MGVLCAINKVSVHVCIYRETMIDHLDIESTSIHRESKEGQRQIQTEIENSKF